ncbi:hypothetical protein CTAYLR_007785 [Chrysophaeum taylorii]|uniref:EF-hand domain-containing protein n=1 Tax=Chrysophaeum taylorii TaxID=2483200 RepID=A0AAD7ULE9_9STRA|nr:hypothetical protein CTAYLR_007785 [Chrysophaeum taylorii]
MVAKQFWNELTKDELAERAKELEFGGENRLAAQYVLLLTEKHPNELVREFYSSTSPAAQVAIQEAITTLLGTPSLDTTWTTTGRQVAELCFRLQMTGYMLRNAEYVLALRQIFNIPTNSTISKYSELRRAFDRVDADGDGFLRREEVEKVFDEIYVAAMEDAAKRNATTEEIELQEKKMKEIESFVRFFDANADGRVSFDEFCDGITSGAGVEDDDDDLPFPTAFTPPISGEIDLVLKNSVRKVDAAEYVASLQAEADRLRKALAKAKATSPFLPNDVDDDAATLAKQLEDQVTSISRYVGDLNEDGRKALTTTITPDAHQAINQLVNFVIMGAGDKDRQIPIEAGLMLERRVLEQLCRWQIIVGYRLRELEAMGAARDRLGK